MITMHKNTMFDILSLNARGIKDQLKMRSIKAGRVNMAPHHEKKFKAPRI